ncbi:MAG: DUF2849 domain-containing protein [Alphaproteobacteria bacterium]|nr:MAG: DUF2849 domain-containing protein [Alphaproteobacteria bacterium]PZO32769.1 MAG: DUF2849 domain-containing protein [Alphaproteobacteria bacterium]
MRLITANRLSDGRVIYLGPHDRAVEAMTLASAFDDDEADAALVRAASRPDIFVNPYSVEINDCAPSGRDRLKETIRANGPTVGHSLDAR